MAQALAPPLVNPATSCSIFATTSPMEPKSFADKGRPIVTMSATSPSGKGQRWSTTGLGFGRPAGTCSARSASATGACSGDCAQSAPEDPALGLARSVIFPSLDVSASPAAIALLANTSPNGP